MSTHTYGGRTDPTAIIGHAPEARDWRPDDGTKGVQIGHQARIEAYVTVDAGKDRMTKVGARTWAMKHAHIGHDAVVGEDCEIAPHATICGYAELGYGVKVGVNACVLPYVKVGDRARVGAGAVVTKDVPEGMTVVGNPARPLVKRRPLSPVHSEDFCPRDCGDGCVGECRAVALTD